VICCGTLPCQKTVTGTLSDIVERASQAGLQPPALIVFGDVVRLRERLSWFERRPLAGRTVVVTRAADQASVLASLLAAEGADVLRLPTIEVVPPADWGPLDAALAEMRRFDWLVFTSVNGVAAVLARIREQGRDVRSLAGPRLAAIGPATARSLTDLGLRVDCLPRTFRAEALAEAMTQLGDLAGKRVLLARAAGAREVLPRQLQAAGAEVAVAEAYDTRTPDDVDEELVERVRSGAVDWVTFTSSSTVRGLAQLVGRDHTRQMVATVRFASIGPVTSGTMAEFGLPVGVEAPEYTVTALAKAIAGAAADPR